MISPCLFLRATSALCATLLASAVAATPTADPTPYLATPVLRTDIPAPLRASLGPTITHAWMLALTHPNHAWLLCFASPEATYATLSQSGEATALVLDKEALLEDPTHPAIRLCTAHP